MDGLMDGWMGGWTDCDAIKLGDKAKIAAGRVNPLISISRKTTLFVSSSHASGPLYLSSSFVLRGFLYLLPSFLSKSIFSSAICLYHLIPSLCSPFFSASPLFPLLFQALFLFPSPSFWPVGKSKNLNNFYTTVGAKKLTRSSWEHSDPRTTGAVSLGGKRDGFVFLDPVIGSPKGKKKRQLNIAASSSKTRCSGSDFWEGKTEVTVRLKEDMLTQIQQTCGFMAW